MDYFIAFLSYPEVELFRILRYAERVGHNDKATKKHERYTSLKGDVSMGPLGGRQENSITKLYWVIVCILFPVIAEGADWVKVVESKSSIFYVVASSITESSPNQYQAWYKNQIKTDKPFKDIRTYGSYDCVESKFKVHQSIYNYKDGSSDTSGKEEWEPIVPGSVFETVLNFVCNYNKGDIKITKKDDN